MRFTDLCISFAVNCLFVVVIIGQSCMNLGQRKVGILAGDFVRGPSMLNMVHYDLGYPNSGPIFQTHQSILAQLDMGLMEDGWHRNKVFRMRLHIKMEPSVSKRGASPVSRFVT